MFSSWSSGFDCVLFGTRESCEYWGGRVDGLGESCVSVGWSVCLRVMLGGAPKVSWVSMYGLLYPGGESARRCPWCELLLRREEENTTLPSVTCERFLSVRGGREGPASSCSRCRRERWLRWEDATDLVSSRARSRRSELRAFSRARCSSFSSSFLSW